MEGEGPLVICLHGFPQGWYLWRKLIDPLVQAGYKVARLELASSFIPSFPSAIV